MGAVKNGRENSGHQALKLAKSQEGLDWSKLIFYKLLLVCQSQDSPQ